MNYCGYGELYSHYEKRTDKNLPFGIAVNLLEYLIRLWKSESSKSYKKNTYISFYGGEPLLNMPIIVIELTMPEEILLTGYLKMYDT